MALTFLIYPTVTNHSEVFMLKRFMSGLLVLSVAVLTASAQTPKAEDTAAPKKLGPVACAIVRIEMAKAIQKRDGIRFGPAMRKAAAVADDESINALTAEAETVAQTKVAGATWGQLGDGSLIKQVFDAVVKFLQSPQGQALIQALVQLLMHALGADSGIDPIHQYLLPHQYGVPPPGASVRT
jgi:hypothetical protein